MTLKVGVNATSALRLVAAPSTKIAIPIFVDPTGAGGQDVANTASNLTWTAARLTFDSVKAGTFGTFSASTGTAGTGFITVSETNPSGTTTAFTLATVHYTTSATTGSTTVLPVPTSVIGQFGTDLTSIAKGRGVDVCVMTPTGKWGDGNGDNTVNIVDAQQIARYSVGLSVANLAAVLASGDVTADAAVNIVDAQQVARFSVGLSAAARINTPYFTPPAVASITATPPTVQLAIGQTSQATATPKNGASASIAGCVAVTWTSLSPAVATVDSTGFITAVANGSAIVRASAGGQNFDIGVQVGAPTAATVTVALGTSTLNGNNTTTATATVRDQFNIIIPGAPVSWSTPSPLVARLTNAGFIQALGAGAAQITATSGSVSGSQTLTVTAAAQQFNLEVRVIGSMTAGQLAAFTTAANKWMQVLRGDVPDQPINVNLTSCGVTGVVLNETVDDIVIYAAIDAIDGPGAILGSAGPCYIRGSSALPIVGFMHFDIADVPNMEANGTFQGVIQHEMGHVLGVGTIWSTLGFLQGAGGSDPIFNGTNALWGFANIGFSAYAGVPVPVENSGGSGTRDSHWRESILDRELMTGYAESGGVPMPLTALTAGSMLDLGYVVNFASADPMSFAIRALSDFGPAFPKIQIVEGPMPVPVRVDAAGRPMAQLRPPGAP